MCNLLLGLREIGRLGLRLQFGHGLCLWRVSTLPFQPWRLYLICVLLTSPMILKLETTTSIRYIVDVIVAQTSLCILFHLYLDAGGVSCIPSTAYICQLQIGVSVQCEELDLFHDHYATFRVASPRHFIDVGNFLFQGRRSSASSPYGAISIVWWRWSSVLIGFELGLLHTHSDSGFSRTSGLWYCE